MAGPTARPVRLSLTEWNTSVLLLAMVIRAHDLRDLCIN